MLSETKLESPSRSVIESLKRRRDRSVAALEDEFRRLREESLRTVALVQAMQSARRTRPSLADPR